MQTLSRYAFIFAMLFFPALSLAVVGGSLYVQGLASPFFGIFIGIAGLFFGIKVMLKVFSMIDEIDMYLRKHSPLKKLRSLRTRIPAISIPSAGVMTKA
jgi:hypothetical protein